MIIGNEIQLFLLPIDKLHSFRPYFTYWVTSVQILVTIVALATYGFGPIGFTRTQKAAMVMASFNFFRLLIL